MLKDNSSASTISHAENLAFEVLSELKKNGGSPEQIELAEDALELLESLYFSLREDQ